MNFTKISWEQLEKDTFSLAEKINGTPVDEIISISRGGMVVSRILSDVLQLPISHIAIESYADLQQNKEPVVTQVSSKEFKQETILLVDELADSGKTFLRALSYLKELPIKKVYTAAPYYKSHTVYIPDFFVKKLDSWIILPYEIRETKKAFIKEFGLEQAEEKMKDLGFTTWECSVEV
ncbi:MAG TPA: phosphoribosyltransferase family protein [Patescibacteria group bacterium]